MLTREQRQDLAHVEGQMATLANKVKMTKQDEARFGVLKSQAASIRAGASLRDLQLEEVNESELRNGLPLTKFASQSLTREERAQAELFRTFATGEQRDVEGAPMLAHLGTFSGLGRF